MPMSTERIRMIFTRFRKTYQAPSFEDSSTTSLTAETTPTGPERLLTGMRPVTRSRSADTVYFIQYTTSCAE